MMNALIASHSMNIRIELLGWFGNSHTLLTAETAEIALAKFRYNAARIQLVIIDLDLPGDDGMRLLIDIVRLNPHVTVWTITEEIDDWTVREANGFGSAQTIATKDLLNKLSVSSELFAPKIPHQIVH